VVSYTVKTEKVVRKNPFKKRKNENHIIVRKEIRVHDGKDMFYSMKSKINGDGGVKTGNVST
jgi:hypothetical protein